MSNIIQLTPKPKELNNIEETLQAIKEYDPTAFFAIVLREDEEGEQYFACVGGESEKLNKTLRAKNLLFVAECIRDLAKYDPEED